LNLNSELRIFEQTTDSIARQSRNQKVRGVGVSAYRPTRNAQIVGEASRFASSRDRCKAGRFAYTTACN
jgi:hypothetical protein